MGGAKRERGRREGWGCSDSETRSGCGKSMGRAEITEGAEVSRLELWIGHSRHTYAARS